MKREIFPIWLVIDLLCDAVRGNEEISPARRWTCCVVVDFVVFGRPNWHMQKRRHGESKSERV